MNASSCTHTDSSSENRDDELLANCILQLTQADDPDRVVEEFCRQHPHLAAEIRSLPQLQNQLQGITTPTSSHPRQLGDFRIIRQMARGGMGIIYEAIQQRLKRRVVLKTMKTGWNVGPSQLRFRREQEVLARLHQTHIVPIHTADEAQGLQYFVMPYIDGASLNHVVSEARNTHDSTREQSSSSLPAIAAAWLKKKRNIDESPSTGDSAPTRQTDPQIILPSESAAKRTLPKQYFRSVAETIANVAEGLHHAHQEGLIHRDIKPSNLMIEPDGKCWIIDFGLAGYSRQDDSSVAPADETLETESLTHGHTIGTPAYMAPEQWSSPDQVDARTDVWGLGVTLYELLTLQRAYAASTEFDFSNQKMQLQKLIEQQPPRHPGEFISNIPSDLTAICLKAMEKEPGKRYATAQSLAEDLRHWLKCEPTRALPGLHRRLWLWAKRHTGWAVAMGLAVVSLFSALALVSLAAAQAQEQLKQRDRESLIQERRAMRLSLRSNGWSEDSWKVLSKMLENKPDPLVRDELAATLVGMDFKPVGTVNSGAFSLAFHPENHSLLLSGDGNNSPRLWRSDQELQSFKLSAWGPVAFDTAHRPVQAFCRNAWTVELRELNNTQNKSAFQLPFQGNPPTPNFEFYPLIKLSSDAQLLALVTKNPQGASILVVWDTRSKKLLLQQTENVTAIAFAKTRDGRSILATGNDQGEVSLWDSATQRKLAVLTKERDAISALAFGNDLRRSLRSSVPLLPELDGMLLAVGTQSGSTAAWRPAYRQLISRHYGSSHSIKDMAFHPDGHMLASTGNYQTRLWQVANGQLILNIGTGSHHLGAVAFSSDGSRLAIGGVVGNQGGPPDTRIFQMENGRGIKVFYGLDNANNHLVFSRNRKMLASYTESRQIGVWDTVSGHLRHLFDTPPCQFSNFAALAFDETGKRLAFAADTRALMWDTSSGKTIQEWDKLPKGLGNQLAFRSDGALILVRFETKLGQLFPASPTSSKAHPRVGRVRNLLAADPYQPLHEITEFNEHYFNNLIAPDASYFLVDAIRNVEGKRERWQKIYDGRNFKEIFANLHQGNLITTVGLKLDGTGRQLSINHGEHSIVLSMPECLKLAVKPHELSINWITPYEARSTPSNLGWALCVPGKPETLVHLGVDHALSEPYMDHDGTHLAWGSQAGFIMYCELEEVRRRLNTVRQGW